MEINSGSDKLSRSPVAFEVRCTDLAARIGKLETPHGIIETPAFVPVVHPVRQTVSPKFLKSLGFNAIITNSYITLEQCGDRARKKGIHDIVNFDGVVMTDSGGYQVLEYGGINVEANVIAKFEKDIGSDICVPLDKPTGYGLDYATARNYVEQTLTNAKDTLPIILEKSKDKSLVHNKKENHIQEPIWAGPIQGAEHLDLVRYSASELDKMGFTLMALGSPVEIMEAYEFSTLARMIASVKSVVPTKPLHLFGAGHPLTIPLAVALGCDMFDSASYILYAKDNRYMHANGTAKLDDLTYLPCRCPVCNEYNSAKELLENDVETRITEVAKHNLYVLKTELNSVKQAIVDGRLWEYVVQKSRAHPRLLESVEILKNFELLRQGTPLFKQKAVFFFDPIDQFRPEAVHFREMVSKFRSGKRHQGIRTLILYPEPPLHPFYATQDFKKLAKKFPEAQICTYNQFLGIIPAEISDIFPAAHNLAAKVAIYQTYDYQSFVDSFKDFLSNNKFDEIIIIADQFFRNIIINDRSVLDKIDAKVFDYTQDAISEIQACRS